MRRLLYFLVFAAACLGPQTGFGTESPQAWSAADRVQNGFAADGGRMGRPYMVEPEPSTGLSCVFLFGGMQGATLRFECDEPAKCQWYQYISHSSQAVPVASIATQTASILQATEGGRGYLVELNGMQYACYVLDYESVPLQYTELVPQTDAEDICESLQVTVKGDMNDFVYYSPTGKKGILERLHTFTYSTLEWNDEAEDYAEKEITLKCEGYPSAFVIEAPLCHTEFTLTGDQFAAWFGMSPQTISTTYEAVRVCQHAKAETDDGKDEINGTSLRGQAPMNVTFHANASPATRFLTWQLYVDKEHPDQYLYRTEADVEYEFETSGTYKIKLLLTNDVCSDSTEFTVTITESSLDCPNFFTPRTSPGENDEFRVAYESLVKFHGRIMNRWGVTLFEWDDPEKGWDGTYNGHAVNPGVYFYIITATGSDGIEYSKRGDINLLE